MRQAVVGQATALLRTLSGPHGIHASAAATANYRAIFCRDAVMAGVAGLLLGDARVTAGLVRTLEGLRDLQGPEGQIASNFEPRADARPHVSFGTLAPRLDSATWYLVGVALAARRGAVDPADYRASATRVVRLLDAIEYNGRHLVYVPAGGNWADEYVTEGYTLYDQALRAWALALLAATYDEPAWQEKAAAIDRTIASRPSPRPARRCTRWRASPPSRAATPSTWPAVHCSPWPGSPRRSPGPRSTGSSGAGSRTTPSRPPSTR
jgi:hypothetical protein